MSTTTPKLTCELITMVAKFLIADDAMASCANLNLTSKKVREATLEVLWTNMYWTAYHDPATYNKTEVEAKWKIFKKSRGAKYIKFMIEPCLFKCNTGYGESPQISKSLSKTLKASITLITCAGQRNIQLHLFGKFGYTEADRNSVMNALDIAKSFPSFESVTQIDVCVHSKLPSPIVPSTSVSKTNTAAHADSKATNDAAAILDESSALAAQPYFDSVFLDVDDSVKIKDLDAAAYSTLVDFALSFVRPYAIQRMSASEEGDAARFIMAGCKIAILIGFGAAWMRLWKKDPFYTTFKISLYLPYDEETGKPFPTIKQQDDLWVMQDEAKEYQDRFQDCAFEAVGRLPFFQRPRNGRSGRAS